MCVNLLLVCLCVFIHSISLCVCVCVPSVAVSRPGVCFGERTCSLSDWYANDDLVRFLSVLLILLKNICLGCWRIMVLIPSCVKGLAQVNIANYMLFQRTSSSVQNPAIFHTLHCVACLEVCGEHCVSHTSNMRWATSHLLWNWLSVCCLLTPVQQPGRSYNLCR